MFGETRTAAIVVRNDTRRGDIDLLQPGFVIVQYKRHLYRNCVVSVIFLYNCTLYLYIHSKLAVWYRITQPRSPCHGGVSTSVHRSFRQFSATVFTLLVCARGVVIDRCNIKRLKTKLVMRCERVDCIRFEAYLLNVKDGGGIILTASCSLMLAPAARRALWHQWWR